MTTLSEHQFCCVYECDDVAIQVLHRDDGTWPVCRTCGSAMVFLRRVEDTFFFKNMADYRVSRNDDSSDSPEEYCFLYEEEEG